MHDSDMSATEETGWITILLVVLLIGYALMFSCGCAGNLATAVRVANVAGQVEDTGGKELAERCTEPVRAAGDRHDGAEVERLAEVCTPVAKGLAALRGARLVLLEALAVAEKAKGDTVPVEVVDSVVSSTAAAVGAVRTLGTP